MTSQSEAVHDDGPILAELAAVGFAVQSLTELRESGVRYTAAIPILVRWLPLVDDPRVKEELVRALSVPWARPAATPTLLKEFRCISEAVDPTGTGLRWVIGNALWVLYEDSDFDVFVELARESQFGRAREMIVLALGKSMRPEAVGVLLGLLDDADVDGHAVKALSRLRAPQARVALESRLGDRRTWVRKAARDGLATLGDNDPSSL